MKVRLNPLIFLASIIFLSFFGFQVIEGSVFSDQFLPPKKQISQGLSPEQVVCQAETPVLILKTTTQKPACVTVSSATKLVNRGWGIVFEKPYNRCVQSSENIIEEKFDAGMIEKIQNLLNANVSGSYSVILFVQDQHKPIVEQILSQCHQATEISSGEKLSFITSKVPLPEIPILSIYEEIGRIGQGELYELPIILPEVVGKTWVQKDPIQCAGNPWQLDWLENNNNNRSEMNDIPESELITNFYHEQRITIHEIKSAKTYDLTCSGCSCARGDTLYLLIDSQNTNKMIELGYKISPIEN